MKDETHENIHDEINEDEQYELDKLSLDKNTWRKRAFERKHKIVYDIKISKSMNHIHDSKVNDISGWKLLHDILKPVWTP